MHRHYEESTNTYILNNKNLSVEKTTTDKIEGKYEDVINVVSDMDHKGHDVNNVRELNCSDLKSNGVSFKSILDLMSGEMPVDNIKSELKINDNPSVYPDEEPPMPSDDNNGWHFNNSVPGKINWYFYGKNVGMDKVNNLQMFYVIIELHETSQPPWLSAYSFKNPSSSSPNWYESRWTMDGAIASIGSNQKVLLYFSPSNIELGKVYPELTDFDGTIYNLYNDYPVDVTGNGNIYEENLFLIGLSTNSQATPGSYSFTVKEYGYKEYSKLAKRVTLKN